MSAFRFLRLVIFVIAMALVSVSGFGCGGGGDDDVATLLEETFDGRGGVVESGKLDLSLKLDLRGASRGLDQPISLGLSGPFENQGEGKVPRFDFNVSLDGGGQPFQAGAISTGTAGFLRIGGQPYELGEDTFTQFSEGFVRASKANAKKETQPSFAALGVDPRRWLRDPNEVGTEKVGGADTVHIRATVDVPRLLEDVNRLIGSAAKAGVRGRQVPDPLTLTERARAAEALKAVKVDLWTGKEDRTLRKFRVNMDVDVPEADRKKAGLSSGTVELEYSIGDLNRPQRIDAPANPRPVAELNAVLKRLGLGGAAGSTTGQGRDGDATESSDPDAATPDSRSTTTVPNASQAYLDCLEAAGDDPAKVSACASELTAP